MPDPLLMIMLPENASEFAGGVDWMFWFIFWVATFFFVVIIALMVMFTIRYRRKHDSDAFPRDVASHNTKLELAWSIMPTFLLIFMFWWGFETFLDMYTPPQNGEQISVRAFGYGWEFTYPNGARTQGELIVPVDRPTILTMTSSDFLHAFYVPDFRVKQDVVPGRWTKVWFKPKDVTAGDGHRFYCAEYCGSGHSTMKGYVRVVSRADYLKELEKLASSANRVVVGTATGAGALHMAQAGETEANGTLPGRHEGGMTAADVETDAGCIVTGGNGGDVAMWMLPTDDSTGALGSQTGSNGGQPITAIAVDNAGRFAFVGDASGAITAWGLVTGTTPAIKKANSVAGNAGGAVRALELVEGHLVSVGADGAIVIWSLNSAQTDNIETPGLTEVARIAQAGGAAAAAINGNLIAVGTGNGHAVYRIDWSGEKPAITAIAAPVADGGHTAAVTAIAVHELNDGSIQLATGSADTNLKIWRMAPPTESTPGWTATNTATEPFAGPVAHVRMSTDGGYVFAVETGGTNVLLFAIDGPAGTTSASGAITGEAPVTCLAIGRGMTAIQNGEKIYNGLCKSCHTIDGSDGTCPTFLGLWGAQRQVRSRESGAIETVVVDEAYINESVRDPDAKISGGPNNEVGRFAGMTAFGTNQISTRDMADIIAFLKSLKAPAGN